MPSFPWQTAFLVSFLLITSFTHAQTLNDYDDLDAPRLRCLSNEDITITELKEVPVDLQPALKLPQNYKLTIRYTDTTSGSTAKITESNYTDALVIHKVQQTTDETFFFKDGVTHLKNGDCSKADAKTAQPVYNISDYTISLLKNDALNMNDILTGIANLSFSDTRVISNITWVDGVKAVSWYGCINQTDKTPGLEIRLRYTGGRSELKPYDSGFKNPVIASVHIIVYNVVDNTTNPIKIKYVENHSFNVVELEHTIPEHKAEATKPPRGVYCSNMTDAKLPSTLPTRFESNIEYVDTEKKISDNVNLMYDGVNHIVSFTVDFDKDLEIPYVQNSGAQTLKGKVQVVQDFNSGFEYVLSKDSRVCNNVAPLQSTWNDVQVLENKLVLRDPTNVFFNITREAFYSAGKVVEGGVTYNSFVSKKTLNSTSDEYIVVELLFTLPDWDLGNNAKETIHSIVQYHKNIENQVLKKTIIRFDSIQNNTQTGTSWSTHSAQACVPQTYLDNFFFLKLADVSMKTIQTYGYENVENALIEAISKTANISVLRISQFLFKTVENELLACFLLGEKNNATPAQTKYLINEKTVKEVREHLNTTLQTQKLIVTVVTDDLTPKQINVVSLGMVNTKEHIQPRPYYGYSGGSMFILGIFSFIFGASGAVAAYVLYMKRQQVRGIAYQVFE